MTPAPEVFVRACPRSPNCVSTLDTDATHGIETLAFGDASPQRVHDALARALQAMPRTRIVRDEPLRIEAECRTLVFRWVDDVELAIDPAGRVVHARSAARTGWSDLGVNRRRIERLRRDLARALGHAG